VSQGIEGVLYSAMVELRNFQNTGSSEESEGCKSFKKA
jgi:hypothetical protein